MQDPWTKLLKTLPRGGRGSANRKERLAISHCPHCPACRDRRHRCFPVHLLSSSPTHSARHVFQTKEDALPAILDIKHRLDRLIRPPTHRPVACRFQTSPAAGPVCCASASASTSIAPRCTCCFRRDIWPSGMSQHVARQLWGLPTTTSSIMTAVCRGKSFHAHPSTDSMATRHVHHIPSLLMVSLASTQNTLLPSPPTSSSRLPAPRATKLQEPTRTPPASPTSKAPSMPRPFPKPSLLLAPPRSPGSWLSCS